MALIESGGGSGIGPDGWKVISFLCTAIAAMFLWIKALLKTNDEKDAARIADLQKQIEKASGKKGKEES